MCVTMCYERRRAEACVDESAHHALANAGGREIVGKKEGEQKESANVKDHDKLIMMVFRGLPRACWEFFFSRLESRWMRVQGRNRSRLQQQQPRR
jgi:hypothetical protein